MQLFDYRVCSFLGHTISIHDYKSLAAEEYLNDAIVNFYLAYLFENLSDPMKEAIHIFSSHFYTSLKRWEEKQIFQ